ncbi:sugar ABC transporter substrate-binding protein [Streptomyces sp. CA-249302]|uniref:sugar ABC transporter substrate-binding protein n=1 Tax=Streptomyces sp. CA-249302 TaxID=3240058 RepID=UPI003D8C8E9C
MDQEESRGKAQVVYFNNKNNAPAIQQRDHGGLAALKTGGPGIQVVSNITNPQDNGKMANVMGSILQAHPGANVVLGATSTMLGVLSAFQAIGRAHDPDVYVSSTAGVEADYDAIEAGTVYRATSAEPWNMWAYCIGQFAADWLEGKSIPRGLGAGTVKDKGVEPMLTTVQAVKKFRSYMADPRGLWERPSELAKVVSFYGNISYATRENWWRQEWTP